MSRFYLVRHGTHALVDTVLVGRMSGVSLSPDGLAEAERVANFFATREVAHILSSPLDRCRETAAAIASRLALDVTVDPRLAEIDCGEWTGCAFDKLAHDARWHAWNSERDKNAIPGGESVHEVLARVTALLRSVVDRQGGPTILVSHSDVIKIAAMHLLAAPIGQHGRLVIDPASVTTVDLWPGGSKVVRLNEAAP